MAKVIQKYYQDDEVFLVENIIFEMLGYEVNDEKEEELINALKEVEKYKVITYLGHHTFRNMYLITYADLSSVEEPHPWIVSGLRVYESIIKEKAEKVDKMVAGAFDLRQKTWGIFLNIYEEDRRTDEYYPIRTKEFRFQDSNCNNRYVDIHVLGKLCVLQETTTSFVYLRERIKYYMDTFGYSKDDIIVGEILPMDHKVTPLK